MNRRQAKKAYKKKHGYNPPKTELRYYPKYEYKLYRSMIGVVTSMVRQAMVAVIDIFDAMKDALERIRTMPDDEFKKVVSEHSELSLKDIEILKAVRRDIRG